MINKMSRIAMIVCVTGMLHSAFAADIIEDMTWRLTDLNQEGIVKDSIVTLEFKDKDEIVGRAGCNSYFGNYSLDGAVLKVSTHLGSTMVACVDPAMMTQEKAFLKLLSDGVSIKTNEDLDKMVITTTKGETLTFEGIKKEKAPE